MFTLSDRHIELLEADNEITSLQNKLAKCKQFDGMEIELVPRYRFIQIKKNVTTFDDKSLITLQFFDLSSKIFYDDIKAQEEYMSLANSTISHEMRNPLNSILAMCKIIEEGLRELDAFKMKVKPKMTVEELADLE